MDDIEDVIDVISAIQEGDYEVVSQAIEQNHVSAAARDQEGSIHSFDSSDSANSHMLCQIIIQAFFGSNN